MPPVKAPKTYSRTSKAKIKSAYEAVNELFDLNIRKCATFKRKRKDTIVVPELHISGRARQLQFSDCSLHVTINDTFDKIQKEGIYRPVVLKEQARNFTSESDVSQSKSTLPHISLSNTFHSPVVRKRKRKRRPTKQKKAVNVSASKQRTLDQSVHYSLEKEKCNYSSVLRCNNITSAEEKSENVTFGVPKICSTPLPVQSWKTCSVIAEGCSPLSSKSCGRSAVSERFRKQLHHDPKLLMVPRVHLSIDKNHDSVVNDVINAESNKFSIQSSSSDSCLHVNRRKRIGRAQSHYVDDTDNSSNQGLSPDSLSLEVGRDLQKKDKTLNGNETANLFGNVGEIIHSTPFKPICLTDATHTSIRTHDFSKSKQCTDSKSITETFSSEVNAANENACDSSSKESSCPSDATEAKSSPVTQGNYITLRNRKLTRVPEDVWRKKRSDKHSLLQQQRSISDMFASVCSVKTSDDKNKTNFSEVIVISDSPNPVSRVKREEDVVDVKSSLNIIDEVSDENSVTDVDNFVVPEHRSPAKRKSVYLKPGKLWRRSLTLFRRSTIILLDSPEKACGAKQGMQCACVECRLKRCSRRLSCRIVPAETEKHDEGESELKTVLHGYVSTAPAEEDQVLEEAICELSLSIRNSLVLTNSQPLSARDVVLRKCGQTEPLSFTECYTNTSLQHCHKIGEGVYGEVFLKRNPTGGTTVMKIIPIEGTLIVNGDRQKKFEEILSEVIVATALSDLRHNKTNQTSCFSEVQKVKCIKGRYPTRLLELWELYDEDRKSENDSPEVFTDSQLYVVLELANGGKDLESFEFVNAQQSYFLFRQVACALAVAEAALSFEHRDLHWGNILISNCDKEKKVKFVLDNKEIYVATCGVEACIIDFTLSRITKDSIVVFHDLSLDEELFTAEGDYQFEIYRLMQEKNGNEWQHFEPYSNVLWLHYVLDKMLLGVRYRSVNRKLHKGYIKELKDLKRKILNFDSVKSFVTTVFL